MDGEQRADEVAADFFISRTGADAAIAIAVADALKGAGYRVLVQDKDFANRNFMERMDAGLASGARVIAIISEDYFKSDHCTAEWQHPLADDPLNKQARLIVLRARECVPRGLLKAIAHWDLVKVRGAPELLNATVLAAVDPAHRTAPLLAEHWRRPGVIRHAKIRETPGFTGRGDELAAIDGALWARETPALTQSAAVQGFGGVGKSTIAREYAWRVSQFDDVYAGVWWLDAEKDPSGEAWPGIEQGFIELGDTFIRGLAQQQDRQAAARTGRDFIEQAGFERPWLIVYDNVDDVRTLDRWPPPKGAHVIVTSRLETKAKGMVPVEIGTWPLHDAVQYLRANSGRSDMTAAQAEAIANALGCLPLALAHAAAYLSDNDNATVESYLAAVGHHMREVPETALAIAPRAVFATLQQNIAQAEARAKGAAAVMSLAAFYAPDAIPEELFRQDAEHYPPAFAALTGDGPESEPLLEKAIGALGRLRLVAIAREGKTFSVHRLVQAAALDALSSPSPHGTSTWGEGRGEGRQQAAAQAAAPHPNPLPAKSGEREIWSAAAVGAANAAYPGDEFKHWPGVERLLPHARAAAENAADALGTPLALLLASAGFYLDARGEYDLAEPLYIRSLAIREKALGPDHPDVGTSLTNLAGLYYSPGKYDRAEPLLIRSLAIREKALGPDHPNVGTSLNNLAELHQVQGKYDRAEPLYIRSLAIREKALGPDHPSVGTSLNNLAGLYYAQGQYDRAEPLYIRDLAISEKALGPDHPSVGTSLNNLAYLYYGLKRFDEAAPLARRAHAVIVRALGAAHPTTEIVAEVLAMIEAAVAGGGR